MLGAALVTAIIPVVDLDRAKRFYRDTLGLKPVDETDEDAIYACGGDTTLYLYVRPPSKAEHTLAGFIVDDAEVAVQQLSAKGVQFEEYDFPGLKTVNYLAEMGGCRAAWFKDPDGNILSLCEDIAGRR